jgi:hypothetical protein
VVIVSPTTLELPVLLATSVLVVVVVVVEDGVEVSVVLAGAVVVEDGMALEPELLLAVFAPGPRLQPARAAASATTAT